jgi:HSP20 family molecular chaperone IbpA
MSPQDRSIRVHVAQPVAAPARAAVDERAGAPGHDHVPIQTPLIDIHDGPDGLILEADLPGASEDSIVIQLEDNVLSLRGRCAIPAVESARLIHQEFAVGEFQRSFILSDEVDRGGISAEVKQGVLRLHLPRAQGARSRRIEVKSQS